MKKRIRLTESDLHRIVKRSVNKILKEDENSRFLLILFARLINGNIRVTNAYVEEGDFEGSLDVEIEFNGGYISASGYGYEENGSDFELASADVSFDGQTLRVEESDPISEQTNRCIQLILRDFN